MRVVRIQWHDAAAAPGWHDKEQLADQLEQGPTVCDSIGMLVERKNKDKVTIIQTMGSGEVSGVFEIPRSCVLSIETIYTLNDGCGTYASIAGSAIVEGDVVGGDVFQK